MFGKMSNITETLFQQFESRNSDNAFDPYQTNQVYEELNQDVQENMAIADKMVEEKDSCFIHGYCIEQPSVNRMQLMVATAAKGIVKKASSAYSTAHSRKNKLQKRAMNLVSVDEEVPVMRGYGVDFCPLFERPFDANFCVDLSDRKNRRNADGDLGNKYIYIPMKTFSSIETKIDAWQLV